MCASLCSHNSPNFAHRIECCVQIGACSHQHQVAGPSGSHFAAVCTTAVPHRFFTVVVNNSAGWAADELANSGRLSMTRTRKLMQTIGVVGPALCLLYLALGHQDTGELRLGEAAALMTGTIAIGGFQSAGFASNHQDISSRYASVLFGITNAASSLMGTFSVFATGLILDATHSWSLVFEGVAVIYLLGGIAFVTLASAEQQFE